MFSYALGFVLIGGCFLAAYKWHRKKLPSESNAKVNKLRRWKELETRIANDYALNSNYLLPFENNPMSFALKHRKVLKKLLAGGHASAASSVMKEVDDIIETIEANTLALDECKLGEWVHVETERSGRKLYEFVPNKHEIPTSIRKGIGDMLNQMLMLIEHVRTISAEGVASSVESAKLQLQVHKQDFIEVKNSMAETTKEIENAPL